MKTALLFPGQGVQKVGMGSDIYREYKQVRNLYNKADNMLGIKLSDICFNGPQEELTESKNAQPAILLHSYAIYNEIKDKITPSYMAGHSLGEYTAYLASGAFEFDDALHLVRFRGELMSATRNGTMSAIIGIDTELIQKTINDISGIVVTANFNSPEQTVISGEVSAITEANKKFKKLGARVIQLSVSGAFHSPLMEEVFEPFRKILIKTNIRKPLVPVFSNVTSDVITEPANIRKNLGEQVIKPVRWVDIIINMKKEGVNRFIEIGHGKILTKLVKKTLEDIETINISTVSDIRSLKSE